jgi:hypothetical protein
MLQSHFFSSSPFLRIAKTDKFSSLVYQLKKRLAKTSYFKLTAAGGLLSFSSSLLRIKRLPEVLSLLEAFYIR